MQYLTSVMRGEVKDQFDLDAPLSERTRCAQELLKRNMDDRRMDTVLEQLINTAKEMQMSNGQNVFELGR